MLTLTLTLIPMEGFQSTCKEAIPMAMGKDFLVSLPPHPMGGNAHWSSKGERIGLRALMVHRGMDSLQTAQPPWPRSCGDAIENTHQHVP